MIGPNRRTDADLLARFRRGDEDAATALYVKYAKRLQHFAKAKTSDRLSSRFDPDDVVQSVFRTFFRRAAEGFFDVPPGEEIWNLFLVITLNKIRRLGKFHRRQRRSVETTESTESHPSDVAILDETPLVTLQMSIDELLQGLPPVKRSMVEMRIQGFAINEIADTTGRCTRTVERTLQQFREELAEQVDDL